MRRVLCWLLVVAIPATSLFILVVWQMIAVEHDSLIVIRHPSGTVIVACIRAGLYTVFLSIPVAAFLAHDPPVAQDDRPHIRGAALVATFLLIALGLLAPSGPRLLSLNALTETVALVVTLVGVAFAVAAMVSLGMSFSFWPEARQLVVHGPYRLVRHPIYLAEIVMSSAILIPRMQLTLILGELFVVTLQLLRIQAEERLLAQTFLTFGEFREMTPYRLIPGVW
jgi:protein-S-isoprenylcysteine O-methyltransferase Ste14